MKMTGGKGQNWGYRWNRLCQRARRLSSLCCSVLLCNQKAPEHYRKTSNILLKMFDQEQGMQPHIDNENIVPKAVVDHLKLKTELHPHPYIICWIKKGHSIKIIDLSHVSISSDKFYQDSVACDVVDMDACHILLGRAWQHDVDATYIRKMNIYMFN